MSKWNCLIIIFDRCNLILDGKRYTDQLTPAEEANIAPGFSAFSKFVNASTKGKVSLSTTTLKVPELRFMSSYQSKPVDPKDAKKGMVAWATPEDVYQSVMASLGSWSIRWGDYDSIFVVQPWTIGGAGLDSAYHRKGLGYFPAAAYTNNNSRAVIKAEQVAFGATYAWFGASANLTIEQGALITHEWLHGVCQFYMHYQYPIPPGESHQNPAWKYPKSATDGWNAFYRDLLSGNVRDQFPPNTYRGGITNDAWDAGTPSAPRYLIGNGSAVPQEFINAWGAKPGCPISLNRRVHGWGEGDVQDMVAPDGRCAIMRPASGGTYAIPPQFWRKFLDHGGVTGIGYPVSNIHRWGPGVIMDFKHSSGWRCGVMQSDAGALHVVRGNIWKAYIATQGNGATSYLGYPKGEEYIWTNAKGNRYHVQQFDGGYCWAQAFSPYKYGNNNQWGDQEDGKKLETLINQAHPMDAQHEHTELCCQPGADIHTARQDYSYYKNMEQDDAAVLAERLFAVMDEPTLTDKN